MIKRVQAQLESQGLGLELTTEAKLLLAKKGYDPQLGARPLRRAIQRYHRGPALREDPVEGVPRRRDDRGRRTRGRGSSSGRSRGSSRRRSSSPGAVPRAEHAFTLRQHGASDQPLAAGLVALGACVAAARRVQGRHDGHGQGARRRQSGYVRPSSPPTPTRCRRRRRAAASSRTGCGSATSPPRAGPSSRGCAAPTARRRSRCASRSRAVDEVAGDHARDQRRPRSAARRRLSRDHGRSSRRSYAATRRRSTSRDLKTGITDDPSVVAAAPGPAGRRRPRIDAAAARPAAATRSG